MNRIRVGTVLGASNKSILADRRFYAGGGGSVKAYGYELAGSLDRRNKPLGGRTIVDGSTEIRQRLFDDWGVVAFIDGAYVEPKIYPTSKKISSTEWVQVFGITQTLGPYALMSPCHSKK